MMPGELAAGGADETGRRTGSRCVGMTTHGSSESNESEARFFFTTRKGISKNRRAKSASRCLASLPLLDKYGSIMGERNGSWSCRLRGEVDVVKVQKTNSCTVSVDASYRWSCLSLSLSYSNLPIGCLIARRIASGHFFFGSGIFFCFVAIYIFSDRPTNPSSSSNASLSFIPSLCFAPVH